MTRNPVWTMGFAKRGITPGRDVPLLGYAFRYENLPPGNDGPWPGDAHRLAGGGPLFAQVCVIHDGTDWLALVTLDICTLELDVARRIRDEVAQRLGTKVERVIVACSHTHSGPFPLSTQSRPRAVSEDAVRRAGDPEWARHGRAYFEQLLTEVTTCAMQAVGSVSPARLSVQQTRMGIGYTRRIVTDAGVAYAWNPREQTDLPLVPAVEDTLIAARLEAPQARRSIIIWSAAAHPVGLGKASRWVSADWPGVAQDTITRLLPRSEAMFLLGACGDSHGWIATQENPADLEPLGIAAGGMVASLAQVARPCTPTESPLGASAGPITVRSRTVERGRVELDLVVWKMGELFVAAVGAELFGQLAVELRKRCPGTLLLATEANGRSGYWPTERAFAEGGYEVEIARDYGLKPGDGEWLVDQVAELFEGGE
ncbi:MAG: hypothetical protein JJU36_11825 [Phycisphaeraceae bacterium]|nr:hypothetical protein [Phycisphaeraceae bacterium]